MKDYLWTRDGGRLHFQSSSEGSHINWLFLPGGPGLGSETLSRLTGTEPLAFAAPYRHFTRRFEHEVYECCRETTATYTATKFGISDKTAAEIYYAIAKQKQAQDLVLPTDVIGIDEIAMRKGHKDFVVLISDLTIKESLRS